MILERDDIFENGETLIMTARKHWMVYVYDLFAHVFGAILLIVGIYFLAHKDILGGMYEIEESLGELVLAGFLLLVWTSYFYVWTKDYFDVWYITDRHLIAVDQKQLFDRDESFAEFSRIQDVSIQRRGLFGVFFGYGTLTIETAGADAIFVMKRVANVDAVARKIIELRDDAHAEPVVFG